MVTFSDNFQPKTSHKYLCNICDFKTSKKCNYLEHINSKKHKSSIVSDVCDKNQTKNKPLDKKYICVNCQKVYLSRNGLWCHKKKCNNSQQNSSEINNISSLITPELIVELIKNNTGMQQTLMNLSNTIQGMVSNGVTNNSHNNTNTNTVNSHNKSFNLQFFLNETCKNAMNIMDFANSIQVKLTDLENIGELGYVEGISKIIIDNLKLLDVTEIPVHCSDFKREMMYVKDNNKWEKENEDKPNIKKLINCVANKNISLISEWKQKYPECTNSNSKKSTQVNKMIMEVMNTDTNKNDKIINKIAKETTIDKDPLSDE
jgi:hypothetical protein